MFFNFNIRQKGNGLFFLVPGQWTLTEEKDAAFRYAIQIEKYQEYFPKNKQGVIIPKFWEGFYNLEKYSFDIKKYNAGKNPFIPFDYSQEQLVQKYFRRKKIAKEIDTTILLCSEVKKIRKLLKKGIEILSEMGMDFLSIPEFKAFLDYSNSIDSVIQKNPKTEEFLQKIDIKKINGA
jgi:hypothetical protein